MQNIAQALPWNALTALPPLIHSAHILIVDDQPANIMLLEKILRGEGFSRISTTDRPERVAEMHAAQGFDLILLDLNMPEVDGFEVMRRLEAVEPMGYVPVIVVTALNDNALRLRALRSGAKDYINKPFDLLEMTTRIRNMLEVRMLHSQVHEQNRLLEERVRNRTRELSNTRLEIIRRLGRAAEYRDNETGMHIIRMSKISALLGEGIGMSAHECELLLNASPMHDIGKIGIPDRILLKPGKLDPEEWEVMKTHAEIGAEILSGHASELMEMARLIALCHHEKWDGSGYPAGLQGEAIPLVGRIVTVADVFDALTSERPYKKAWPIEDAIHYINEQSGQHFDPAITAIFSKMLPQILAIRENHPD
ncbi:MAG: HD domain-containing phosphohydrolase [Pseudomonadota bacterium]